MHGITEYRVLLFAHIDELYKLDGDIRHVEPYFLETAL